MLVNFFALIIMFIGLYLTISPKIPGTVIIIGVAFSYSVFAGVLSVNKWLMISLVLLSLLAEVGGRLARIYLTKDYNLSREFSTDATAGNLAGVIATDALFGPMLGTFIWELIVGKTFLPRWDTITSVLMRLAIVALVRFGCGLTMIILISKYILH